MRRAIVLIPLLILLMLPGCKPAGQLYSSMQYHNIRLRLVKSVMTMTVGDGSIDARGLMKNEQYSGSVTTGRVTVEYPEGLDELARELAADFDSFYPVVQEKLGIEWSFDLVLKLVRVEPGASGFRYSVKLPKSRRITFPIPVSPLGPDGRWTPVVAHELTEASLIAPKRRGGLVLSDIYSGDFCIPTGARWFRDGVSDYAQQLFDSSVSGTPPPGQVYSELDRVRERLLSWSNCNGQPNWYNAAAGLLFEMENRFGEDSVARMMDELSKESVPGSLGIRRAFRRATGTDLEQFLRTYETPWTGFTVRDTAGRVVVTTVYSATPASRRGIEVGDVIVTFAGEGVTSAGHYAHILARQRPWEMVAVEVERNGQRMPMKLKLIPRSTYRL